MKTDNKLIAEFMGVKEQQRFYDSYGQDEPYWYTSNGLFRTTSRSIPDVSFQEFLDSCRYDLSWDWLMPVVQKVKTSTFLVEGSINPWIIAIRPVNKGLINADLTAVYKAVVEFINWYNSQNQ